MLRFILWTSHQCFYRYLLIQILSGSSSWMPTVCCNGCGANDAVELLSRIILFRRTALWMSEMAEWTATSTLYARCMCGWKGFLPPCCWTLPPGPLAVPWWWRWWWVVGLWWLSKLAGILWLEKEGWMGRCGPKNPPSSYSSKWPDVAANAGSWCWWEDWECTDDGGCWWAWRRAPFDTRISLSIWRICWRIASRLVRGLKMGKDTLL